MVAWAVIILSIAVILNNVIAYRRMNRIEADVHRLKMTEFWRRQGVTDWTE